MSSHSATEPAIEAPPKASWVAESGGAAVALAATWVLGINAWMAPELTILLLGLPWILNQYRWRLWPLAVGLVYFGAANAELSAVISRFHAEEPGLLVRAGAPVLLTIVQSLPFLLYRADRSPANRAIRMSALLVLMALPPLGWLTWRNPLLASGLLFPGWGFLGLAATAGLFAALAAAGTREGRKLVFALGLPLVLVSVASMTWAYMHPRPAMSEWIGVDTTLPPPDRRDPNVIREEVPGGVLGEIAPLYFTDFTDVIVFPESVFDPMTLADQVAFSTAVYGAKQRGVVILAGASVRTGPDSWRNTVQAFGAMDGTVDESRIPMPMGNWRLGGRGVPLRPFASDTIIVETRRGPVTAAMSICYEDTLIWPHAGLLAGKADVMVSVNNAWATAGTRGDRTQTTSAELLARLGGVPLVRAKNTWSNPSDE